MGGAFPLTATKVEGETQGWCSLRWKVSRRAIEMEMKGCKDRSSRHRLTKEVTRKELTALPFAEAVPLLSLWKRTSAKLRSPEGDILRTLVLAVAVVALEGARWKVMVILVVAERGIAVTRRVVVVVIIVQIRIVVEASCGRGTAAARVLQFPWDI